MPLKYKIDIVEALKKKGYNTTRIRKERILSESTLTKLRHKEPVSWDNLQTICELLECQPGDIIEFIKE